MYEIEYSFVEINFSSESVYLVRHRLLSLKTRNLFAVVNRRGQPFAASR